MRMDAWTLTATQRDEIGRRYCAAQGLTFLGTHVSSGLWFVVKVRDSRYQVRYQNLYRRNSGWAE